MTKQATRRYLPNPGVRVGYVDGPGVSARDNAGTVLAHIESKWGDYALVMMDDGTIKDTRGVTTVGIGCYVLV